MFGRATITLGNDPHSSVIFSFFSRLLSQVIGWEEPLRNDLFCVEWDVKPLTQPGIERVQALADISRSALYAIAVYKAISLHTCVLS